MEEKRQESSHPPYMLIFGALFVLTAVEVSVAFVGLPRVLTIWALVLLALWKALLVALYFMHLRFERIRVVLLAAVPIPLAFILVLVVLVEYAR